jgi:DNA uptake protein ComE-like DNA-binding protein
MKGFLTGIGLGTAIGLWLAPDTGSQTRKKLMTRAAKFADSLEKTLAGKSEELDGHAHIQAEQNRAEPKMRSSSGNHEMPQNPDPVAEVLNTASKTQLRKVPGIGDATAKRIIENRPFETEAEVVENKVLPATLLKKLRKISWWTATKMLHSLKSRVQLPGSPRYLGANLNMVLF